MPNPDVTIDLVARDKRFREGMTRVERVLKRVHAQMKRVAQAARRMLLVGGAAIAGLVKLANDQERAEAKLAAVLKATGNAAGISAEEMFGYARSLQRLTTYGDEAIIAIQAVLATFKEIKGDVFRDAIESILDMSVVLDQDAKSGAIQLGKALNDPIRGITALTRVGVSFTDAQKEQIRILAESGKTMEAQRVILNELQSEFGGAARAVARTFGGKIKQTMNLLGDLGEQIGAIFLGPLSKLSDKIADLTPQITLWVEGHKQLIMTIAKTTGAVLAFAAALPILSNALLVLRYTISGISRVLDLLPVALRKAKAGMMAIGGPGVTAAFAATAVSLTVLIDAIYRFKTATDSVRKAWEDIDDAIAASTQRIKEAKAAASGETLTTEGVPSYSREEERQRAKARILIAEYGVQIAEYKKAIEEFKPKGFWGWVTGGMTFTKEQQEEGIAHIKNIIKYWEDEIERLRNEVLNVTPKPREAPPPIVAGPDLEGAERVRKTAIAIARALGGGVMEALKGQAQSLDDQAKSMRSIYATAQERLQTELQILEVLSATGRISDEEYAKYKKRIEERYKDATDIGQVLTGSIEGLTASYRRIREASVQHGAKSVAATAAAATAKHTAQSNVIGKAIERAIRDVLKWLAAQRPQPAVYGA